MLTSEIIERELKALKPLMERKYKVKRLGYFGSFASQNQHQDSDIDILVEFAEAPGWDFFDLQDLLEERLQKKVDLVSINALKAQLRDSIVHQVRYV
jgi:predicted nucleotidyltransferase